jgi:hypothetical protein
MPSNTNAGPKSTSIDKFDALEKLKCSLEVVGSPHTNPYLEGSDPQGPNLPALQSYALPGPPQDSTSH